MPRLVYKDSSGREVVLGLRDKDVTIGRQTDCDLVVSSPSTSRKHARVERRGAKWVLVDLGSSHGTFVNGTKLEGEHPLLIDDAIAVGEAQVVFDEGPAPVGKIPGAFAMARPSPTNPRMVVENDDTADGITDTAPPVRIPKILTPTAPMRSSGEILETARVDSGELMAAISRARKADFREKQGTELGALMALVRIADELRQCTDETSVVETTARMALNATGASRALLAVRQESGSAFEPAIALDGAKRVAATDIVISSTFVDKVVGERIALLALDTDQDVSLSKAASVVGVGIRSIVCAPLWDGTEILGYLYLDTVMGKSGAGKQFRRVDVDLLTAIAHHAASEIRRLRLATRVRQEEERRRDLGRFLAVDVIRHIEREARAGRLDPTRSVQEVPCTILFASITGFTRLAESTPPAELKRLLDEYLGEMTEILVDRRSGTLDKFMGDEIMALFGAPFSRGEEVDAREAVAASLEMRDAFERLRRMRPEMRSLKLRIGINTGRVVAGMLGTARRLDYTVIGDAVNVASALEKAAAPGMILVGETTWKYAERSFRGEMAGDDLLRRDTKLQCWWIEGPRDAEKRM